MMLLKSLVAGFATVAALTSLSGCARPTLDHSTLKAIRDESEILMKVHRVEADEEVPQARWPRSIASIEPQMVSINSDGVYITTKAYFDGGWGYFVPRQQRALPEPVERFEEVGQGIYWWEPY